MENRKPVSLRKDLSDFLTRLTPQKECLLIKEKLKKQSVAWVDIKFYDGRIRHECSDGTVIDQQIPECGEQLFVIGEKKEQTKTHQNVTCEDLSNAYYHLSQPDVAETMAIELRASKIRIEILGNILGKYYIDQNNQFHLPSINKALAAYEAAKKPTTSETENE